MFKQLHKHSLIFCLLLFTMLLLVPASKAQEANGSPVPVRVNDDLSLIPVSVARIGTPPSIPTVSGLAGTAVTAATFPQVVDLNTRRDAGSQLITGLQTAAISQLTIDATRLVPADLTSLTLNQDPTADDPFDNLNDGSTFFTTLYVSSETARLAAELVDAAGPDIKLFVGQGLKPSAKTVVCQSDTAVYCNVLAPEKGDWWILVQNRAKTPHSVTLAQAVVPQNDSWCSGWNAACLEEFQACLEKAWFGECWQALIDCFIQNMDEATLIELEACLQHGWDDDCFEELEDCFPNWLDWDDALDKLPDSATDDDCDDDHDDDEVCECDGEHQYDNQHEADHFKYRERCYWWPTIPQPNMWVEGPDAVAAQESFDLRVFWDDAAITAGDIWYAAFDIGSNPAHPGDIGTVMVDLNRFDDDVVMQVSADTAVPGDILTYTIAIQPNVTPEDPTYVITDTIPAGMTYVPGSAQATGGKLDVTENVLTWTGPTSVPGFTYRIDTSATNPACAAPSAGADGVADGYLDLATFGFVPDPVVFGNSVSYQATFPTGEFHLFGAPQGNILNFTDDGFAYLIGSGPGTAPQIHQPIPNSADPNNLLAMLWRDMELVYDGKRGVIAATLFSGSLNRDIGAIIEFNGVRDRVLPASAATYDFEIVAYFGVEPNRYEYVFAYDNLSDSVKIGTIGLENLLGTDGVQYGFDDLVLSDGMAICFDQVGDGGTAVEITYQATIDDNVLGTLTNETTHNTNNPGSKEASTSVDVTVNMNSLYLSDSSDGKAGEVVYSDEDIVRYDLTTGQWSLFFDGSDLGLKGTDIDALHVLNDGSILLSLSYRLKIPGFGKVDDSDIIRFLPKSLGENTTGTFEMYFDGSDYGLHHSSEDVDAIGFTSNGRLLVSTTGAFKVPRTSQSSIWCWDNFDAAAHYYWSPRYCSQLRGADEDLIVLDQESGSWELYFNGSHVLDRRSDLGDVWIDPNSAEIYLSSSEPFTIGPLSGDALDIFVCQPLALGRETQCAFPDKLFFDGSEAGLSGNRIDGFAIGY